MKNKLHCLSTLLGVTGRSRTRTIQAAIVLLQVIALPLTRASETLPADKSAGDHTAGLLPPSEQRAFDKSVTVPTLNRGTDKRAAGSVVSGVLPPGPAQFDKKSAAPGVNSVRSAASLAAGSVSGPATAKDLKNYQKPGGNNATPSVLVLPVRSPAPGMEKVAVGTVTGPASPEELRGYVKPAVLPAAAPEPARAPTSGTVPAAELKPVQK